MTFNCGSLSSELIVKQYLISKNYATTIKALEQDSKLDKNRGRFQAHKLVDALHTSVVQLDLATLRDTWQSLELCLFRHLDYDKRQAANALKHSLFKAYLVEAARNKHPEKVTEFFEQLALELQQESPEWKEWLAFPFMKNPQEHKLFAMFFTRSWMDIFLLSLHNFMALVLAAASRPILHQIEMLQVSVRDLIRENSELRGKIHNQQILPESGRVAEELVFQDCYLQERRDTRAARILDPVDLLEDFSTIESDLEGAATGDGQAGPSRGFMSNMMRKISSPSSPLFRKKGGMPPPPPPLPSQQQQWIGRGNQPSGAKHATATGDVTVGQPIHTTTNRSMTFSAGTHTSSLQGNRLQPQIEMDGEQSQSEDNLAEVEEESLFNRNSSRPLDSLTPSDATYLRSQSTPADSPVPFGEVSGQTGGLLALGQERLNEHQSPVSHCRFSRLPSMIASLDAGGCMYFWQSTPTPRLVQSASSKGTVFSFDWRGKSDRLCIIGNKASSIRLYDVRDNRAVHEVVYDSAFPRINLLESFASGDRFVCGALSHGRSNQPSAEAPRGRLSVWNLSTMKPELELFPSKAQDVTDLGVPVAMNSCCTGDSENVILTGGSDGVVRVYDLRQGPSPSCQWRAHGDVEEEECLTLALTPDGQSVYSLGTDGRMLLWSLSQPGRLLAAPAIHSGAAGPFKWVRQGKAYRQVFRVPRGQVMRLNPAGDAILTCAMNGAKIYQLSKTGEALPGLSLTGHDSPVISLDWSWGEELVTCLTASMDGTILVSTLLTNNSDQRVM